MFYNVVSDPECIRKEPAYGDRPPDSRDPEDRERRQRIGKGDAGPERHDRQDDRHPRFPKRPVQSVEQEEDPDQCIESAFDAQITDAFGYNSGLTRINKQ